MKEYILTLPVGIMQKTLDLLDVERETIERIDAEQAALPALNAVEDGVKAMKKREEDLTALEARRESARASALAAVESAYNDSVAQLDRQVYPSGADIVGSAEKEADFKLLECALIESPEALAQMAAKYADVPGFRVMIKQYAARREWEGFNFIDKHNSARGFIDDFFTKCRGAAKAPTGYFGLLLASEGVIRDQADAFGLSAEYRKSVKAGV